MGGYNNEMTSLVYIPGSPSAGTILTILFTISLIHMIQGSYIPRRVTGPDNRIMNDKLMMTINSTL